MTLSKRLIMIAGLVAVLAIAAALVTLSATGGSASTDENGDPAHAGQIDDGKELQSQAGITLDQAIAAAQTAATGSIGEVDLEYHDGKLVYNVDVGDQDVKVDAANGAVLGASSD